MVEQSVVLNETREVSQLQKKPQFLLLN